MHSQRHVFKLQTRPHQVAASWSSKLASSPPGLVKLVAAVQSSLASVLKKLEKSPAPAPAPAPPACSNMLAPAPGPPPPYVTGGVLAMAVAAACANEKGGCGDGAEKALQADDEGNGEGAPLKLPPPAARGVGWEK